MASKKPTAGDLRHKLNFQKRGDGDDGLGGVIPGTGEFATVFDAGAKLVPARGGSESVVAGRLAGKQMYYCTFRYHNLAKTVDASWRVVDDRTGKVYQVKSPISDADQKNAFLDMIVEDGGLT